MSRFKYCRCRLGAQSLIVVWSLVAPILPATAGTLQVGAPVRNGDEVTVPVVLQGDVGPGVAAMDFHLVYDPAVLEPVAVVGGQAALAAHKTVSSNMVEPGQYVVVLFGMNQTVMQPGEVASISLRKVSQSQTNQSQISLTQLTLATVEGREISSQGSDGTISFGDSSTPPPTDGGTPPPPTPPGTTPPPVDPPGSPFPPIKPPPPRVPRFDGNPDGQHPDTPQVDLPQPPHLTPFAPNTLMTGGIPATSEALAKLNSAITDLANRRLALNAPGLRGLASPLGQAENPATANGQSRQLAAPKPSGTSGNGGEMLHHRDTNGSRQIAQLAVGMRTQDAALNTSTQNKTAYSHSEPKSSFTLPYVILVACSLLGALGAIAFVRRRAAKLSK